ncbi:MAG: hypothetical protein H6835_10975 [Planctomycetes bacterium]|nr:hypothetical protein [Planctomycetota bacterium]
MPRLLSLGGTLAACLLTACSTTARPAPLAVQDTFVVDYQGRVQPVERLSDDALMAGDDAMAQLSGTGSAVQMQALLVELPTDEVRALLPTWPRKGPRLQGAHIEREDLLGRLDDWRRRNLVAAESALVGDFGVEATFRSLSRRAYISHLDIECGADPLMVDPQIGVYEYGLELGITPRRDGDETALAFDWRSRDRITPSNVGHYEGGRIGSIELPMMLDQRVRGQAEVVPGAVLMLGAMVGSRPNTVCLLCVDVRDARGLEDARDRGVALAAGAQQAAIDAR